jgi:hypothetical protein
MLKQYSNDVDMTLHGGQVQCSHRICVREIGRARICLEQNLNTFTVAVPSGVVQWVPADVVKLHDVVVLLIDQKAHLLSIAARALLMQRELWDVGFFDFFAFQPFVVQWFFNLEIIAHVLRWCLGRFFELRSVKVVHSSAVVIDVAIVTGERAQRNQISLFEE